MMVNPGFQSGCIMWLYGVKVVDFHCGLRMYNTERLKSIQLECTGMEYASEMIIKAQINGLSMCEVSTVLRKDLRDRKPHLKTIRDGFRHLFIINKIKFQSSAIFRYASTFILLN